MMQRSKAWWGYLALLVALMMTSVLVARDFDAVVILSSMMIGYPIYRSVHKSGHLWRLIPYGLLLGVALAVMYYVADLLVFPHSPRATHRLHDACIMGLFLSFAGFFIAWMRDYKGLPMLNDPPAESAGRRQKP